jgi:hypothetical protein
LSAFAASKGLLILPGSTAQFLKMPLRTEDSSQYRGVVGYSAPLNVILLAGAGLALLGAGALLAFDSGTFVSFGDAMLAAIAWCL